MPTTDAYTKTERLLELQLIFWQNPRQGLRTADVARLLGVPERTARNYLDEFSRSGRLPIYKDRWLWRLIEGARFDLLPVQLSLEEGAVLYLAARLLARHSDEPNPSVRSALLKLVAALPRNLVPHLQQQVLALPATSDPQYADIFRTVTYGWATRRTVRLSYHPLRTRAYECLFQPYLLEPSAIGYTVYAIGHSNPPGALRTYKLERIVKADLTEQTFELPKDFDGLALLKKAWGVMYGEDEPVTVRLRFTPWAARRVKETVWHPSQQITELPDGSVEWSAHLGDLLEITPWIRGWGADVEVLEPPELRTDIADDVSRLARRYLVSLPESAAPPAHRVLWAKADHKTKAVHRLVYHMIDVGMAAQVIWERTLHPRLKQRLADWLGLTVDDAGRLLAFLASLHDLGKASPAFQDHPYLPEPLKSQVKEDLQAAHLELIARPPQDDRSRHEEISAWALRSVGGEQLLHTVAGLPAELAGQIAQALGGHHGAWPRPERLLPPRLKPADTGGRDWETARADLVKDMKQVFRPPVVGSLQPDTVRDNVNLTLLSAIVAAADWIGSDETYFPFEPEHLPLGAYVRHARKHGECAVASVQWEPPVAMPDFAFERVFPFPPNDTQRDIARALEKVTLPALAIIEAPMGVGKTEAAFAAYAGWAQRCGAAGLYVAMPTMATSNQMHGRTADFLSRQIGKDIEPLLVHSQALLRDTPEQTETIEADEEDTAAAQAWFLPRKKSLLAAYGVGTVDQALMGVLQTKHFFVRLLGLSHKVVIFDEVHAYDAYMSELFERLLVWLRAVDASVIVLSATLPGKTRHRLVAAYSGTATVPPDVPYPRLTFAGSDGSVNAIPLLPPPSKVLHYDWMPRDEQAIVDKLRVLLAYGGCAALICNTVSRAQHIFQMLRYLPDKLCDDENLILFHARFPMAWRQEIEEKVLRKFGPGPEKGKPNPNRPQGAIVVATQVIEQSLDLDFDVMISDHAPIDLLLQRSGRLHRHRVNDRHGHADCLWIAEPPVEDGVPHFEASDTYVYDDYTLLRSWLALKQRPTQDITIPADVSSLIEEVYGEKQYQTLDEHLEAGLSQAWKRMRSDQIKAEDIAAERLVREPGFKKLLTQANMNLGDEDDPELSPAFRALTRMGDPGVQVVCLHRIHGQLHLEPDGSDVCIDPNAAMDKHTIIRLARHTVTVRHPDPAVSAALLASDGDPDAVALLKRWKHVAALRYCRPLIFEESVHRLCGTSYVALLDRILGLQIIKEAQ